MVPASWRGLLCEEARGAPSGVEALEDVGENTGFAMTLIILEQIIHANAHDFVATGHDPLLGVGKLNGPQGLFFF